MQYAGPCTNPRASTPVPRFVPRRPPGARHPGQREAERSRDPTRSPPGHRAHLRASMGREAHVEVTSAPLRVAHVPSPASPGGVRTYEELEGGKGRVLTFRPRRFAAPDFSPLQCTVTLEAGGVERECVVRDVSRNGVAFARPDDLSVQLGQSLELSVRLDKNAIWSGRARVRSVREQDGGTLVAAAFGEGLLDTDELRQLREIWIPGTLDIRLEEQPWRALGAHQFKALVSELRLYLETIQDKLR